MRRAATAAAAIVLGRGIKEAGSSLQCLAENPSVQLPLLLPVELQKVSRSARVVVRGCFRQWKQQAQAQGARRRQGHVECVAMHGTGMCELTFKRAVGDQL